jgi:cyclomaltodextrinase
MRLVLAMVFCISALSSAPRVVLLKKDATVWAQDVLVRGRVDTMLISGGIAIVNGVESPFSVDPSASTFSLNVHLHAGVNTIVVRIDSAGTPSTSDTLRLTLGYVPRPEIEARAAVTSRTVNLSVATLENPEQAALSFHWTAEGSNPASVAVEPLTDTTAKCTIPETAPWGQYVFRADAVVAQTDTLHARVMITLDGTGIHPFDIVTDHARWIDSAVIYQITPYNFVASGRYGDITAKLPELAQLGVTTVYLQPVYKTRGGGQGYDVMDFFALRPDLGSEADLRQLIATAHSLGLRVLFDFVPNHSSIYHPYAQQSVSYGTQSHYYDYYQRTFDTAPYSMHYKSYQGFVNYFWNELPNFNYSNTEVQRMIIEAGRYWVDQFDIDGYRIDVAWGPNARNPEFMKQWRLALKRLKPGLLLIGEDKASQPMVFDGRFDAAYDWAPEQSWVSHWVWSTTYSSTSNPTIFNNTNEAMRASLLRASLTNNGTGYHAQAIILRFMENNDTFRFLATHDLARTKMVAALLFSLPGLPMLYNGQEIGVSTHPYSTYENFYQGMTIQRLDTRGLFSWYSKLASFRRSHPALYGRNIEELQTNIAGYTYAYHRWEADQHIFGVLNLSSASKSLQVQLPFSKLGLDSTRTYFLTDILTGEYFSGTTSSLASLALSMPPTSARLLVLDTVVVTTIPPIAEEDVPRSSELSQNYPNPFNAETIIRYQVSATSGSRTTLVTLQVFDLLGREVATLVNEPKNPGAYEVRFDANRLASGVYLYRFRADASVIAKTMVLIK